jgi:RNA polymerase sigma factor, sigma-70 family
MNKEKDLIYRFTAYITKVIQHARIDYVRKVMQKKQEILLEDVPEYELLYYDEFFIDDNSFHFQSPRVENAYNLLPHTYRHILELTFLHDLSAHEIAKLLHYSLPQVYLERHRALKRLKELIERVLDDG